MTVATCGKLGAKDIMSDPEQDAIWLFFAGAAVWAMMNAADEKGLNAVSFIRFLLAFAVLPAVTMWIAFNIGEALELGPPMTDLLALTAVLAMISIANRTISKKPK